MIVTVTLNPALHVRYQARHVSLGSMNPVSRARYRAGGRGLAVARVLHTFGHEVVVAGLAGGASGEVIRAELARAGVATQFTWITGESRRILEVADDAGGTVTRFGEPAPYITTEELGRLAADYRSLMGDATAAVLCGSLPDGLPAETYGSLASYAAEAGVPVVLDAYGAALRHGASRRPALVVPETPDDPAAAEMPAVPAAGIPSAAGKPDPSVRSATPDPHVLVAGGAGAVAIAADHAVRVVTGAGEWRAGLAGRDAEREPRARSGLARSGGALVAGFVPGIALGWSWPDTLRHAVAIAAAAGETGELNLESYERLLPEVWLEPPAG